MSAFAEHAPDAPEIARWEACPDTPARRAGGLIARALRSRTTRVALITLLFVALTGYLVRSWVIDQLADYVVETRSPPATADLLVDDGVLRAAAERSRGTHGEHGAIHHIVNYESQLLAALERPSYAVEADVTVIEGEGFLQHDPKDPVGMRLLELLEYAAIADLPIVKLDLKRDKVGSIMDEVQHAVEVFGLDPTRVQFNADVFDGPGVRRDLLGGREHLSWVDARYNQLVMELEVADLELIARGFPESRIIISAATRPGRSDLGYSDGDLDDFLAATARIRRQHRDQPLAFAVRADLALNTDAHLLGRLAEVPDSYIATWWPANMDAEPDDIETLRQRGVSFFDTRGPDGTP